MVLRGGAQLCCVALLLVVAACAAVPQAQIRQFQDTVGKASEVTEPFFDQLSVAERQAQALQLSRGVVSASVFNPADAGYYATIGDAPATAEFRAGFKVVESFAELLVSLSGGAATERKAAAQSVLTNIGQLVNFTKLGAFAAALSPVIEDVFRAVTAAQARQLVLAAQAPMKDLLHALRAGSQPMFTTLTVEDIPPFTTKPVAERKTHMDAVRAKVANFVVVLNDLEQSFDALLTAYRQPNNTVSLAAIAQITSNLNVDLQAARRAMATLGMK